MEDGDGGYKIQDTRYKMQDGVWKIEVGGSGYIRLFKSRRDDIIIMKKDPLRFCNPEGVT